MWTTDLEIPLRAIHMYDIQGESKKTWFSAVERPILKLGSPNFRWSFNFL